MKKNIISKSLLAGLLIVGVTACTFFENKEESGITAEKRMAIDQVCDSIILELSRESLRTFKESNGQSAVNNFLPSGFSEKYGLEQLACKTTKRVMRNWNLDDMEALTPFQKDYHNRLQAIINEENMTIARLKRKVLALEKQIKKEAPSAAEAEQLLCVTSIARYSAEYWKKNAGKWTTLVTSKTRAMYEFDTTGEEVKLKAVITNPENQECVSNP